jgi:hypothetical protein
VFATGSDRKMKNENKMIILRRNERYLLLKAVIPADIQQSGARTIDDADLEHHELAQIMRNLAGCLGK